MLILGAQSEGAASASSLLKAGCCCCFVAKSCPTLQPPQTTAHQAPLSMGLPRQEYWSGLPFLPPGDLPNSAIKPESPALAGGFVTTESPGKPFKGVFWVHSSPGTKSPKDPELSLWRVTPLLRTTSAFGQQHHPPANKTSPFLHPKQKSSRLKSHSGAHCGSALRCGLHLFCSSLLCLCTFVLQSLQTISPTPSSCSGMSPSGNKGTACPKSCLFSAEVKKNQEIRLLRKYKKKKRLANPRNSHWNFAHKRSTWSSQKATMRERRTGENTPSKQNATSTAYVWVFLFSGVDFLGERAVINYGQHPCSRSQWQWPQQWAACWKLTKADHMQPHLYILKNIYLFGTSSGSAVKNPSANARDKDSIPGLGGSHMLQSN